MVFLQLGAVQAQEWLLKKISRKGNPEQSDDDNN